MLRLRRPIYGVRSLYLCSLMILLTRRMSVLVLPDIDIFVRLEVVRKVAWWS